MVGVPTMCLAQKTKTPPRDTERATRKVHTSKDVLSCKSEGVGSNSVHGAEAWGTAVAAEGSGFCGAGAAVEVKVSGFYGVEAEGEASVSGFQAKVSGF